MQDHPRLVQLDTKKMETLQELSDTNMKVSEARNQLAEVKAMEVEYLISREAKAAAIVDGLIVSCEDALLSTEAAMEEMKGFGKEVFSFADRVLDLFGGVQAIMKRFDEKSALWEKNVQDREGKLEEGQKALTLQRKSLENTRKGLDERAIALDAAERKLASDRIAVEDISNKLKEVK